MKIALHSVPQRDFALAYLRLGAREALLAAENTLGRPLTVTEMWRDPLAHLVALRLKPQLPKLGYDGHTFGISIDIDVGISVLRTEIGQERILTTLKNHGWHLHNQSTQPTLGIEQFDFLGIYGEKYLIRRSFDPKSWNLPVEDWIEDNHGDEFRLDLPRLQEQLVQAGLYRRTPSGELDLYTREGLLALQRMWRIPENGQADPLTCRTLVMATCDYAMA